MKWDQKIFVENILELVEKKCDGNQKKFNNKIGRDSVSRWKGGKNPSIKTLLKITEEFKCSLIWLLTGKDDTASPSPSIPAYPPEIQRYLKMTTTILQSHTEYSDALKSNINAFHKSVDNEETELQKLKKDMAECKENLYKVMDLLFSQKKEENTG